MKTFTRLTCLLACLCLFSCDDDDDKQKLKSDKQIVSYVIEASINGLDADIKGVIDEEAKTITLEKEVPVDKNLIASFQSVGKVYVGVTEQISGKTSNNLLDEIVYKVVAEDESEVTYDLIAKPQTGGEAMTDFKLTITQKGEENVIEGKYNSSETIITVDIPSNDWIEDIEKAVATFESEGTVYIGEKEQESGVSTNDFRDELVYEVKADGQPDRKYRVVVISPQSTGLPVIKIDTEGGAEIKDKENYVNASFTVSDVSNKEYEFEEITGGIRGRGNSTWLMYPKKPYRIKFDEKTSMFELGEAKSWVLRANYQDPTFIMNTVAFEIGQRLDLEFTNHARHAEVFLNNEYKGSYLLTEQVQVNKHRVDIDEDKGYLVEFDTNYDEPLKFKTPHLDLPVNVKSPEVDSESQIAFVKESINELEAAMFDDKYPNTNYRDLIDVNTVINYLLVNEIVKNAEIWHPKSVFLYKDVDSKIKMGPIWDFDWGFGYIGEGYTYFEDYEERLFDEKGGSAPGDILYAQFFKDPQFRKEYKERWNEIKGKILDIDLFISEYGEKLSKSAVQNKEEWDNKLDFPEQIEQMKTWYNKRFQFLDESINAD